MTDSAQAGIQAANRTAMDGESRLEFTAEVVAVREVTRTSDYQVWQVALSRTSFHQDQANGVIVATARSGKTLAIPVVKVVCDGAGEIWHTIHKPLQEGTQVKGVVHLR